MRDACLIWAVLGQYFALLDDRFFVVWMTLYPLKGMAFASLRRTSAFVKRTSAFVKRASAFVIKTSAFVKRASAFVRGLLPL